MIDPSLMRGDPFDAPIPGQSLTDTPNKWQWEKPPVVTDPKEAYEGLVESLKSPLLQEKKLKFQGGLLVPDEAKYKKMKAE